jgi:hypothetical protein
MQEPPPGYETQGEDSVNWLHWHTSLYSRKWYEALSRALAGLGFSASLSSADPGVFLAKVNKHIHILATGEDRDAVVDVNGIHMTTAFTRSSLELIAEYKHKFNDRYTLTNPRPIHWFLGIKITRDRSARTISLSQTSYIDSILTHFGLGDALCTLTCSTFLPCPTLSLMDDASHHTYSYGYIAWNQ